MFKRRDKSVPFWHGPDGWSVTLHAEKSTPLWEFGSDGGTVFESLNFSIKLQVTVSDAMESMVDYSENRYRNWERSLEVSLYR